MSSIVDKLTGSRDDDGYFIVRSSRGIDWGNERYFCLPYAFVQKHGLDIWLLE